MFTNSFFNTEINTTILKQINQHNFKKLIFFQFLNILPQINIFPFINILPQINLFPLYYYLFQI